MVNIIFKNKTKKIDAAEIEIDGKIFIFKGEKARELAKMSASDYPTIKNFIENLMLQST